MQYWDLVDTGGEFLRAGFFRWCLDARRYDYNYTVGSFFHQSPDYILGITPEQFGNYVSARDRARWDTDLQTRLTTFGRRINGIYDMLSPVRVPELHRLCLVSTFLMRDRFCKDQRMVFGLIVDLSEVAGDAMLSETGNSEVYERTIAYERDWHRRYQSP